MKDIKINENFMLWFLEIVENIIVDSIEEEPKKFPIFTAVNDMINKLSLSESIEISDVIGEEIINRIFNEIKSNI